MKKLNQRILSKKKKLQRNCRRYESKKVLIVKYEKLDFQ